MQSGPWSHKRSVARSTFETKRTGLTGFRLTVRLLGAVERLSLPVRHDPWLGVAACSRQSSSRWHLAFVTALTCLPGRNGQETNKVDIADLVSR
jgi:hypothetical protein